MADDLSGGIAADNNDGSLHHAALTMPDFDDIDDPSPHRTSTEIVDPREARNRRQTPPAEVVTKDQRRETNGRYADGFETRQNLPPEAEAVDDKADPAALAANDDAAGGLDDEWFELPAEKEGDQPRRIKADEVFRGYQEAAELREALQQVVRVAPPPPQYDEEIIRTVQARSRMVQELHTLIAMNQPAEPDAELINDQSPRYNPAEYQRQLAYARDQAARLHNLRAREEHEQALMQQEQGAIHAARRAREQSKLLQFWPELRDPVVQRQVRDDAARYFGVDDEIFDSVLDARFYAVLRHALSDIHGRRQRQQTVKVVRAKPKLVRGSARDSNGSKQSQMSASMRRLSTSGSIDDAADAIGALI